MTFRSKFACYFCYFTFGVACSCLLYMFNFDTDAAIFYTLGVAVGSVLTALIGSIVVVFSENVQRLNWWQKAIHGLGWIVGALLGAIVPSPILVMLLLYERAGILYLVNINIWGADFCRVDIPGKCLGTGYSSLFMILLISFFLSIPSSVVTGRIGRSIALRLV